MGRDRFSPVVGGRTPGGPSPGMPDFCSIKLVRARPILLGLWVVLLVGCAGPHLARTDPVRVAGWSLREAREPRGDTAVRIGHYLQAARGSAAVLGEGGVAADRARTVYNAACAELAVLLRTADDGRWWGRPSSVGAHRLRIAPEGDGVWAPDYFTTLLPTDAVDESRVKNPVKRSGVGGVLVGVRKMEPREAHAARVGLAGAVTATLDFEGPTATLALRNPRDATSEMVGGARFPLAADFSAPLCYYPHVNNILFGMKEALNSEKYADLEGLYFLEPYDRDRIPVIYVHGLTATPVLWRNPINEVNADPELRKRYQAVVYGYPSGTPFAYSANHFRKALAALEKHYPMPNGYVLVGHSMGGLLSRMQAQTVTRADWRVELGAETDVLFGGEPYGETLEECGVFEADPKVRRIVFICTPHRGAQMADQWIGRLARHVIRVPSSIVSLLSDLPEEELSLIMGDGQQLPTSVSSLAPENVTFKVLNAGTVEVPVHSIVGTGFLGQEKPLDGSSDGVVPYSSSHLDYAASEVGVPTRHSFAPGHRATIAELRRILHLHLDSVR